MNPLPQYACPPRTEDDEVIVWSQRVLTWARQNVAEVRHSRAWAHSLQLNYGDATSFLAAILIQALCAAYQRAYVEALAKPIFVTIPEGSPLPKHVSNLGSLVDRATDEVCNITASYAGDTIPEGKVRPILLRLSNGIAEQRTEQVKSWITENHRLEELLERCLEYVKPVFDPKAHQLYSELRAAVGRPVPGDEE